MNACFFLPARHFLELGVCLCWVEEYEDGEGTLN